MYLHRLIILLIFTTSLSAQEETEIYVMDLHKIEDFISVKNVRNISKTSGYDSQPSFFNDEILLFAGTEKDQTEIISYDLRSNTTLRINTSTPGGEYSPQKFPNSGAIAAVRLDPDGLQRLYSYDLNKKGIVESKEILADYKVAYFAFYDDDNILATVIEDGALNLIKANLSTGEAKNITASTGRSIHKVPGTENMSYTAVNNDGIHEVYIINILGDNESYYVCDLPIGIQDHCWLSGSELLLGSGSKLYTYDLFGNGKWEEIADLSNNNISEINRITVSPDKSKIALVGSPIKPLLLPGQIVDAHITPFNNKDLRGFSEAFSEDVTIKRFPNDTTQVSRQELYESYQSFFKNNDDFNVSVTNRVIHNEWVIDKEQITINGRANNQITLYKTKNGLIAEMTFINSSGKNASEAAANAQLEGYNARDIDAFIAPYDEEVIAMRYPKTLILTGKDEMKKSYGPFFQSTPDLHCTITNRLVSGNIIVDQEEVIMNGATINAVAIYEIENNKIVKVTFLPN